MVFLCVFCVSLFGCVCVCVCFLTGLHFNVRLPLSLSLCLRVRVCLVACLLGCDSVRMSFSLSVSDEHLSAGYIDGQPPPVDHAIQGPPLS